MSKLAAAVIVTWIALGGDAVAEPMLTTLDEVMAQSTDIVIATYEGPANSSPMSPSKLRVERALRGKLSGDVVAPLGSGHASVKAGARVVAFLDKRRAWSFVGEALPNMGLEGAISLRGFYDFNAHLVTPGLLTLPMLEDKIAGRPITWRIAGPLVALADDGSRIVDTTWQVRIDAPEKGLPTVSGLPATAGLPAPSVGVGGWNPSVGVSWRTGWPRPLVLRGEITGVKGDTLVARFHVEMPDLLRVKDIGKYLGDANASHAVYKMRIVWADGDRWSVVANHDYSSLRVFDARGAVVPWDVFDMRGPVRHIGKLELGPRRPGVFLDERGDQRVLIQEILRGPISVTHGTRKGMLELVDIVLAPPVRAP
jgi:hypothetical protein